MRGIGYRGSKAKGPIKAPTSSGANMDQHSPKKSYPSFKETANEPLVEGEHIWIDWTPKGAPDPWIICRWCQHFKHAVKHSPCTGPMKVHLN